jgi:hypothetical protein
MPKALDARDSSVIEPDDVHHFAHVLKMSPRFDGTVVPISFFHFVLNVVSSFG